MNIGIDIPARRGAGLVANPASYLDPALLLVGLQIGNSYVPGSYTFRGQAVTLGTPTYTVNGSTVAANYVLATGDLVAAAAIPATVGSLNVGPIYAEPSLVQDFSFTTSDLQWQVPPGIASILLLEDGTSAILLEDGTSKLLLEA